MPKLAGHYVDGLRQGAGYNMEVVPWVAPIMEFDLTAEEDREALLQVFELEYEQVISIKGAPEYLVMRGSCSVLNNNFRWDVVRRSHEALEPKYRNQTFTIPAPFVTVSHEEFFNSLPIRQQEEFIFFLDHLI